VAAPRPDRPTDADIEELATRWLAAERRAASHPVESTAEAALEASRRFEEAIHGASQEELRLAWEAARRTQASCLMGSNEWSEARTVSELLRMEYLAATDARDP
jgi:hypothetical protein